VPRSDDAASEQDARRSASTTLEERRRLANLPWSYRFETYVKGPSNALAWEACKRLSHQPGARQGVLSLQGAQGLGKSHLMSALGHEALERNPRLRVRFVDAGRLHAELTRVHHDTHPEQTGSILDAYRDLDLVLFDDPGVLIDEPHAQGAFASVLGSLLERGKTIVIADDRCLHEIPVVDAQLRRLFSQSVVMRLSAPDLQTRLAILRRRAAWERIDLPGDVAMELATTFVTHVREMVGALRKLGATSHFYGIPIDRCMARQVLPGLA
jgi:chromosomal replication initiator protein